MKMAAAAAALRPLVKLHSEEGYPPLVTRSGLALPRSRVTEVFGGASTGRTSLVYSALAQATEGEEVCAYIDASDTLDAASAAGAGITLHRVLWVRCGGDAGKAMKATDLILQAGSFGVVVLDLGDTPVQVARRIPLNYWYRFRRAVEGTRTIFVVIGQEPNVRQCAAVSVEAGRTKVNWSGSAGVSQVLDGAGFRFTARKPVGAPAAEMEARVRGVA